MVVHELLLHDREIDHLEGTAKQRALARDKELYDKRELIKERGRWTAR